MRLCDLPVKIDRTVVAGRVRRLHAELEDRGLHFKPHVWLSSEWFSPDGVPGIAVPFYLAHPRLTQLERKMMLEVEGGSETASMMILRHETGHCLETAFALHRRKKWRQLFGLSSVPYPQHYQPKPYSKSYVHHLDMWYAQAHPSEDFAETFAVWLRPGSRWRQRYKGWPALKKLEYVDELMHELAGQTPAVRSRKAVEPLRELKITLGDHYRQRRLHYFDEWPEFYDSDLRKLFSDDARYAKRETAARFLNRVRPELRRLVSRWTGEYQYTIDQALQDMIDRCRELRLRVAVPKHEAVKQAMVMTTVLTMNYLHTGQHRVAL
jgi:hypothetical protein